jgi:hypothetical protein
MGCVGRGELGEAGGGRRGGRGTGMQSAPWESAWSRVIVLQLAEPMNVTWCMGKTLRLACNPRCCSGPVAAVCPRRHPIKLQGTPTATAALLPPLQHPD